MSEPADQKPAPTTGLTPVQIGAALGLAALAWMIADWLRWVT